MNVKATLCAMGCATALMAPPVAQPDVGAWPVRFTDVAASARLVQPSIYGGVDRKRFIIETNGCGGAFVDYDRDGWIDALVLSGTQLEPNGRRELTWTANAAPRNRLYRNRR